jgi:hypothetical protein
MRSHRHLQVSASGAGEYPGPLNDGIVIVSSRYSYGDEYTDQHDELMPSRPRRTDALEFVAALKGRMGGAVRRLPGFDLDVAEPTTIGSAIPSSADSFPQSP